MLNKLLPLLILLLSLSACAPKNENKLNFHSVKDDLGNDIVFNETPKKIITLAPNLTEMIYELGIDSCLIGNTKYCDYPEAALKVEKVGDMLSFNFERIKILKPDIVFITVEGNTKETYNKFRELGIKIFVSNPRNYSGIKKTFSDFGEIFGVASRSRAKVARWDSTINRITELAKGFPQKSSMFLVELKPVMLAGRNTFINEYFQFCGLNNIADDSPMNYPMYSREEILKRDPDFIIYPSGGAEKIDDLRNAYPEWARLKSIKNGSVIFVDRNLYMRPGPRFFMAVNDLFQRLHPQAY